MFAGPNGSGKSTLKSYLPPVLLGVYLNPDEMESEIRRQNFLDFTAYDVTTTADAGRSFFQNSKFLHAAGFGETAKQLTFANNRLEFGAVAVNSYFASVASDFLRQKLME
jgi:predicted ABC-type ATPase